MHVPDGFLSPKITLPAWGAAAPLLYWAVRRNFGASSTESLPVVGSLAALAFVVQSIMVPVPGGTSAHLTGVAILAILYNPGVAFVPDVPGPWRVRIVDSTGHGLDATVDVPTPGAAAGAIPSGVASASFVLRPLLGVALIAAIFGFLYLRGRRRAA